MRPFADFLRDHRGGRTMDEATDILSEAVATVAESGGTATVTLSFKIKQGAKHDGTLEIDADLKLKLPDGKGGTQTFFLTPENDLTRQDPRQENFDIGPGLPSSVHRGLAG
jgi:hypothetical protein